MPSVSLRQRRYFGAVAGGAIPKPKGMTDKQVHDFAATKEKGLPAHMADGLPAHMADGGWMQRARVRGIPQRPCK